MIQPHSNIELKKEEKYKYDDIVWQKRDIKKIE